MKVGVELPVGVTVEEKEGVGVDVDVLLDVEVEVDVEVDVGVLLGVWDGGAWEGEGDEEGWGHGKATG